MTRPGQTAGTRMCRCSPFEEWQQYFLPPAHTHMVQPAEPTKMRCGPPPRNPKTKQMEPSRTTRGPEIRMEVVRHFAARKRRRQNQRHQGADGTSTRSKRDVGHAPPWPCKGGTIDAALRGLASEVGLRPVRRLRVRLWADDDGHGLAEWEEEEEAEKDWRRCRVRGEGGGGE